MKTLHDAIRILFVPEKVESPLDISLLASVFSGDQAMLLEQTTIDDIVATHLLDTLNTDDFLTAAITTRKDRLERTMRALIKSLNTALTGTELVAGADAASALGQIKGRVVGNAIVSKPRKSGLIAIMTAEIPLSDGQSIFIIFHAPDDDPLKITNTDTLMAFRFLLNKRDITHIVAPNQGRDISLKQTVQALANVAEKNSAKFQQNKENALNKKRQLEQLQEQTESIVLKVDELVSENSSIEQKTVEVKAKTTDLEKQIKGKRDTVDSLQAKLDELKLALKDKQEQERKSLLLNAETATDEQILDLAQSLSFTTSSQLVEQLRFKGYSGIDALSIANKFNAINQELIKQKATLVDTFKKNIELAVEGLVHAIKTSEPNVRAALSSDIRIALKEAFVTAKDNELEQAGVNVMAAYYAHLSNFCDTALTELQNGGLAPLNIDLSPETNDVDDVTSEPVEVDDKALKETHTPAEPDATPAPVIDPELLALQKDIDKMEAQRVRMKAANRATQKYNRNKSKDEAKAAETLEQELAALGYKNGSAALLIANPSYSGKVIAHESWELTNLGNRIKTRIARRDEIESRLEHAAQGDEEYELTIRSAELGNFNVTVEVNYDDDRLRIHFHDLSGKPTTSDAEYEYIQKIRRSFNWSYQNTAWQRKITDNARRDAAWGLGFDNWDALKLASKEPQNEEQPSSSPVEAETLEDEVAVGSNVIQLQIQALESAISNEADADALIELTEQSVSVLEGQGNYDDLFMRATNKITELLEAAS